MVKVLVQALKICAVGTTLGLILGFLRGFPDPPPRPEPEGASATCGAPVPSRPAIRWISQGDARALLDRNDVAFVDARPRDVFQAGHISGSLSVPLDTGTISNAVLVMLRPSRIVVAYDDTSGGCAQSTRLAGLLSAAGLSDVRVLEGGMPAWLSNGSPAEAGTCRLCPSE